jgi:hypothetical protein
MTERITLRQEHDGADSRYLEAYVDDAGDLHIDGQDLGPSTAPVSPDGEHEWFRTVKAEYVPQLLSLLGGSTETIIELLARDYTGPRSYDLERILQESGIPTELSVY